MRIIKLIVYACLIFVIAFLVSVFVATITQKIGISLVLGLITAIVLAIILDRDYKNHYSKSIATAMVKKIIGIYQNLTKSLFKLKQRPELALLILILILVVTPYLFKSYDSFQNSFNKWQEQRQAMEAQKQAQLKIESIKKENQRIDNLLQTYNITTLENSSPCHLNTCPYELTIPANVFPYRIGEEADRKFGTNLECRLGKTIQNEREYIAFLPGEFSPYLDLSKFETSYRRKLRNLSEKELFVENFRTKGLFKDWDNPMDKCERLNYEEKYSLFEQDVPSIEKMVAENPQDTFVVNFNNTSFSRYLQLKKIIGELSK